MAFLDFIGARDKSAQSPSQTGSAPDAPGDKPTEAPTPQPPSGKPSTAQNTSSVDPPSASGVIPAATGQSDSTTRLSPETERSARGALSFPANFRLFRKSKSPLSPTTEKPGVTTAPAASTDQAKKEPLVSFLSDADRRAKQSALVVRSFIVGKDTDQGGVSPQGRISKTQLKSVKAQLLEPKSAAKVIAQLRALPALANSDASRASAPIQAVCLSYTDEEADRQHLNSLRNLKQLPSQPPTTTTTTTRAAEATATTIGTISSSSVLGAAIESVTEDFRNLNVVNLFTAPNFGLGQPGDGPGLLAGALPTAETVIDGIIQITPQLMALGYATGKAIIPDHHGVYPPTDRISVLTYWWGMEVLLPEPTMAYLSRVESISGTVINVLTALGVMVEGVREILPFVRYFSQYIDFEFKVIKAQDRGKGVVCAATWIMPAAIVPRPWDFADRPKDNTSPPVKAPAAVPPTQTTPPSATHDQPSSSGPVQGTPATPSPPVEAPAIPEPSQPAPPAFHDQPSSSGPVQDPPASSPPATHDQAPISGSA